MNQSKSRRILPGIALLSLALVLAGVATASAFSRAGSASANQSIPPLTSPEVQAQEATNLYSYTLYTRWTAIAWLGEDGIPASEALGGTGANEDGNDVSADIASIWYWDAAEQEWQAYFPVDLPGASDFETLTRFNVYWVALADDVDMVEWEIESTVTDVPMGYPTLLEAMEAYIEAEGESYAGECLDIELPDGEGTWCSRIETQSASEATVSFGPTFSEFQVTVTFESQAGEGWVVTGEEPFEPDPAPTNTPTATATATETVTETPTATETPSGTTTPTATATETETETPTATATSTETATPTATGTATLSPE